MARTYGDAVTALNTLQTNAAAIDAVRKAGNSMNLQSIPEMTEWCRRAGYEVCASQHQDLIPGPG
ncbi:MAG: hypothetical protein Q9168_008227 [Polycauliona sp. 1 TL-2023]